jgi:hypothetical protein
MTRIRILAALLLLPWVAPLAAADDDPADPPHVRVLDLRLRSLFEEGKDRSPTFQGLVRRLEQSNVVVYIEGDRWSTTSFAGRLSFLSTVAGTRYLLIRVAPLPSSIQQLAMMGHELQHAVEVADSPEVVDEESFLREYRRIGYISGHVDSGLGFDTRAAIDAGWRVAEELRSEPKLPVSVGD